MKFLFISVCLALVVLQVQCERDIPVEFNAPEDYWVTFFAKHFQDNDSCPKADFEEALEKYVKDSLVRREDKNMAGYIVRHYLDEKYEKVETINEQNARTAIQEIKELAQKKVAKIYNELLDLLELQNEDEETITGILAEPDVFGLKFGTWRLLTLGNTLEKLNDIADAYIAMTGIGQDQEQEHEGEGEEQEAAPAQDNQEL
mmetsp:Transcript_70984/g.82639  ORF Transcript_70984/g.82639 Transcript_70984/m.82639 type:complete len:202 (+) Transcript_70984:17-622(+)